MKSRLTKGGEFVVRSRYLQNGILAFLQDYKKHTMQDICSELEISRSTCLRHLNDLSLHYNIQTYVGRYNGGVRLIGKKKIEVNLNDDELQLVINKLESLQDSDNIRFFTKSLARLIEKEQHYERKIK